MADLTCPKCNGPAVRIEQTGALHCASQCEETLAGKQKRLELQSFCADMGRLIGGALPPGVGFAFVLFDFGSKGNMAYISNAQRADMKSTFRELLDKLETEKAS